MSSFRSSWNLLEITPVSPIQSVELFRHGNGLFRLVSDAQSFQIILRKYNHIVWHCELTLASSQVLTQALTQPSTLQNRGENRKSKRNKTHGSIHIKWRIEKKNKCCNHSSPLISRPMPSLVQSNGHLLSQNTITTFFLYPSFYCYPSFHSMFWYNMEYPSSQFRSAVPAVSSSKFLPTSNLLASHWGEVRSLMFCSHCLAVAKTLLSYQHCFSHKFKA